MCRELIRPYGFVGSKRLKDEALRRLVLFCYSYALVECFDVCREGVVAKAMDAGGGVKYYSNLARLVVFHDEEMQ